MEFIVTMGSGKGRTKLIKFHVFVFLVTEYSSPFLSPLEGELRMFIQEYIRERQDLEGRQFVSS